MRKLTEEERDLIVYLLEDKEGVEHIISELPDFFIEEMNDGGMGSLRFRSSKVSRLFGRQIAEISLLDEDMVPVSFAVFLDKDGDIYEFNVFKADFSPLKKFPIFPYSPL